MAVLATALVTDIMWKSATTIDVSARYVYVDNSMNESTVTVPDIDATGSANQIRAAVADGVAASLSIQSPDTVVVI